MSEALNTWIGPSMSFEKEALVAYHEKAIAQAEFCTTDVQFPITRPVSAPLSALRPVSLLQLLLQPAGKKTALYGILCTDPLKSAALCTIFEDLQGRACLLRVHNLSRSPDFLRKFAKGSKIVIKEPCLQSFNLGRALFVFNPADIVSVIEFPRPVEPDINLLKHNRLIRHRDLKAAVNQFSSCLEACSTSVSDANHVHGICRKARGLLDMKEYEQALQLLLDALHQRTAKRTAI